MVKCCIFPRDERVLVFLKGLTRSILRVEEGHCENDMFRSRLWALMMAMEEWIMVQGLYLSDDGLLYCTEARVQNLTSEKFEAA